MDRNEVIEDLAIKFLCDYLTSELENSDFYEDDEINEYSEEFGDGNLWIEVQKLVIKKRMDIYKKFVKENL